MRRVTRRRGSAAPEALAAGERCGSQVVRRIRSVGRVTTNLRDHCAASAPGGCGDEGAHSEAAKYSGTNRSLDSGRQP